MQNGMPSSEIRAIAMAFASAVVAAVATMFIPVGILETITGATGLSELIPAARAPLGDTARALIAFGAGAFTLAALAFVLLRKDKTLTAHAASAFPEWSNDEVQPFHVRRAQIKLPSIALPKMPWRKGEDDITELSDLPKLRSSDIHPDAPPRRPLSAEQDLPVLDSDGITVPAAQEAVSDVAVAVEHACIENAEVARIEVSANVPPMTPDSVRPTLADMVAQLEVAVAERQKQLAELEAVATQLGAGQTMTQSCDEAMEIAQPSRIERRPLEVVPASAIDDDMDSALAAALATLRRMNGTDR